MMIEYIKTGQIPAAVYESAVTAANKNKKIAAK
jgi:hypothetical protein